MKGDLLLEAEGLVFGYERGDRVLDEVSLWIGRGETLGLAGASGSGKTTLARILLRLVEPSAGAIRFDGLDLLALRGEALRRVRPRLQLVFQDPMAAFNPRATVARIIEDPLRLSGLRGEALRQASCASLASVGLGEGLMARRPHEISGGERQRLAIARAMARGPSLIVLDEPVAALDLAVRNQILNLILDLQEKTSIACLLISHDLAVIRAMCHRVAILDAGRIVEEGDGDTLFRSPQAEATRRLIEAVPRLELRRSRRD